jgi:hypothetical protein
MRLKSDIWVMAYVRRLNAQNVPAMVVRRGDERGGAIYIKVALLDGRAALYGPAPSGMDGLETERRWIELLSAAKASDLDCEDRLVREREFDPDLWIVEVEDRQGRHFLDDALIIV